MNFYLVQYNPVLCTIERYTALGTLRVKKEDIEKEKKFYEEVNASDYYHNTVVLVIKAESTSDIENQVNAFMKYLYT